MSRSFRLAVTVALCSCTPSPTSAPAESTSTGASSPFAVDVDPDAPLDAVPAILRLSLARSPGQPPVDETRVALIEGEVGSAHLGQLARDDVSNALSERIVPSLIWRQDDLVLVAPMEPLEPGERYAVASGAHRHAVDLVVAEHDELSTLRLLWPPDGRGSGAWPARWCGAHPLPAGAVDVPLAPDRAAATLATGATSMDATSACIRLVDPSDAPADALRLAPPAYAPDDEPMARIEPTPLSADAPLDPVVPLTCEGEMLPFGPGCIRVWDDRALVLPPAAPMLWVLSELGHVVASEPERPFLVDGLTPSTSFDLDLGLVDRAGFEQHVSIPVVTAPPMPHVVINEVLANPVGEEPHQEWVELYNDGLIPAQLGGWQLEDVGGEATLPDAVLPPGAFALVVNETFDAQSEWDPMPPPHVPLLRVPELGKNGLANGGEPMRLRDASGAIVSRFPDEPKPKAGQSVARTHPKALDGLTDSFVRLDPPTPGEAISSR